MENRGEGDLESMSNPWELRSGSLAQLMFSTQHSIETTHSRNLESIMLGIANGVTLCSTGVSLLHGQLWDLNN